MQGDTLCTRCGASEESINHVFFECPPAVQVWALWRVPSSPDIFPMQSIFFVTVQCSQFMRTEITYFGGFVRNWKITNLHEFYGIYGKDETTKSLVTWILILEILLNWRKGSLYFGLRCITHLHEKSTKIVH